MKSQYSRILGFFLLLFFAISNIKADSLKIENFTITGGEAETVNVSVENNAASMFEYIGFQFDLFLPTGLSVASAQLNPGLSGFTLQQKDFGSGTYRFLGFSSTATPATSTDLLTITFEAEEMAPSGNAAIKLQNVIFSAADGADIKIENSTATADIYITTTGISLSAENLKLMAGQTNPLIATVSPVNATDKTVSWSSQAPEIATVGDDGTVTAVSKGITTITATCGTVSAECQVTVYDNSDITVTPGSGTTNGNTEDTPANNTTSGGSLNGSDLTLRVTQKGVIRLQLPEGLTEIPTLEWSLADGGESYVTLQQSSDTEASFTGVAMGETSYYVRIEGETDPIVQGKITVIARYPMTSLSLTPSEITVAQNAEVFKVTANFQPDTASAGLLEWSNSQSGVAGMTSTSQSAVSVTPLSKGQTVITVKANDGSELTAQCTVNVTAPVDEEFGFDFDGATMNGVSGIDIYIGETYQLQPKAQDGYDLPANITWSSSDPQTVSVTNNGTVQGLKLGSADITASAIFNGKTVSATCTVNVKPILASTIKLSAENLSLFVGQTATLTADIEPQNTTDKTITWESENPTVASVTEGKVTGLQASGTPVNITAKCGNATAVCTVMVSGNENVVVVPGNGTEEGDEGDSPAENTDGHGSLIGNDLTLRVGQTAAIAVQLPDDLSVDPEIEWALAAGGTEIVTMTVDPNTLGASFTGQKMGVTTYTISLKGQSEEIAGGTITVIAETPITSLELEPAEVSIAKNANPIQLNAKYTPATASEPSFSWTSSQPSVATVSEAGLVIPVGQGQTVITATAKDGSELSATSNVTVTNPIDTDFDFDFDDAVMGGINGISIYLGDTYKLKPKAQQGHEVPEDIIWKSNDPQTVSVEQDGTVTGLRLGSAVITATATFNEQEVSASCTVTVIAVPATEIQLNTKDATIFIGETVTIEASVKPDNTTNPAISWSSDNTGVATVDNYGTVTGISDGQATITAQCGDVRANCTVTVKPIDAEKIEMEVQDITLLLGQSTVLLAKVLPENTTYPTITWSSEDTAIVSVTSDGKITAEGLGTTTITATCGKASTTCKVTVNPVPSEGIVVNPETVTLIIGATSVLTATVTPSDTTDKTLVWSSDNTSVAVVSSDGVVTALSPGNAIITVSNGTVSATCTVTVLANTATSITLNVEDQTIYVAATTQLVATVSPDDAVDKTVTWTSNDPTVATVDANGLVTGVSAGTATITATCGNISATCVINVIAREREPINVTTSDLQVKTMDGKQVLMWVSTEGGNPEGWSFSWTYTGEVVSTEKNLEITARNSNDIPVTESYSVNVRNMNDGVLAYNETFTFNIEIWPLVELPFEEGADDENLVGNNDGTTQDEDGWWKRNGIHVETLKTREGNHVGMYAETPQGGYNDQWDYNWTIYGNEIGTEREISYTAAMSSGYSMEIEVQTPLVTMTNYGPEGEVWYQASAYGPTVDVYRRPQTPLQMLRKGDGTSHTFIAMMPLSDAQISQLQYQLVYGYTDANGNDFVMETTDLRYCHTTGDIFNNHTYNFWVYSIWNYTDGSIVSSGLRYLDGNVDEEFDASVFNGDGMSGMRAQGNSRTAIYTIDGQYMGSDAERLAPGIYIRQVITDGVSASEKFIVR